MLNYVFNVLNNLCGNASTVFLSMATSYRIPYTYTAYIYKLLCLQALSYRDVYFTAPFPPLNRHGKRKEKVVSQQ
jgi:hypothetical protein